MEGSLLADSFPLVLHRWKAAVALVHDARRRKALRRAVAGDFASTDRVESAGECDRCSDIMVAKGTCGSGKHVVALVGVALTAQHQAMSV
jgi:hypothetical protein